MKLNGKTALVTGAAQNIGAAIARRFASEGARVVIVDCQEAAAAELAATLDHDAFAIAADLSSTTECSRVVREAEQRCGHLDILVNNAYAGPYKSITEQDDESWHFALAIGLTAMMATCRAALPGMIARGSGTIINLGSINSFTPCYGMAAYAAVKGGICNFTRQLAVEYGERGIRANTLCPGFITNPSRDAEFAASPIERARIISLIPLRRVGTDDDCARAAVFLASDDSAFITGHDLLVDGGQSIQNAKMATWPFAEALEKHPQSRHP
jgi:NAD(P)-dependent dehydrogenase (short-subunit alcohol dehydrogenase family)